MKHNQPALVATIITSFALVISTPVKADYNAWTMNEDGGPAAGTVCWQLSVLLLDNFYSFLDIQFSTAPSGGEQDAAAILNFASENNAFVTYGTGERTDSVTSTLVSAKLQSFRLTSYDAKFYGMDGITGQKIFDVSFTNSNGCALGALVSVFRHSAGRTDDPGTTWDDTLWNKQEHTHFGNGVVEVDASAIGGGTEDTEWGQHCDLALSGPTSTATGVLTLFGVPFKVQCFSVSIIPDGVNIVDPRAGLSSSATAYYGLPVVKVVASFTGKGPGVVTFKNTIVPS